MNAQAHQGGGDHLGRERNVVSGGAHDNGLLVVGWCCCDLVRPIILYVEIGDARKAYGRR